jgi:tetratricopeptide (TPR) repeat protein
MFTSLHIPDDPSWREDPSYSFDVADRLISTFKRLRAGHGSVDTYLSLLPALLAAQKVSIALVQRQHLVYALALCWNGIAEPQEAIACLDHALELSARLADSRGFAECAYLRGATSNILLAHEEASINFLLCLQTLRASADRHSSLITGHSDDPSLELNALLGRAGVEFMLAHNDLAMDLLDEAAHLLESALPTPSTHRERAILAWLRSLTLRWSGAPGLALPFAIQAAELLNQHGSLEAQGRIQIIVADTALDIAEIFARTPSNQRARDIYLGLADPYIDRARALSHTAADPAGEGLASLALARVRRMAGRHLARASLIEDVIRSARQLRDPVLLGQAYLALGHELASNDHLDRARNRFVAARQLLETTDAHALNLLAQRALVHHGEQL